MAAWPVLLREIWAWKLPPPSSKQLPVRVHGPLVKKLLGASPGASPE
jgi:hypothetical protein